MLVLPTMDPAMRTCRSASLSRAFLRYIARATTTLSIMGFKIVGTTIAMFSLPRTIHLAVQCISDLYELLGRRARSPWETQSLLGYSVPAAIALMVIVHGLLFRISYNTILDQDLEEEYARQKKHGDRTWRERKVTWERVLVRVVIPVLMYWGLCCMVWKMWDVEARDGSVLVRANAVDLADDANAQLVWRDR